MRLALAGVPLIVVALCTGSARGQDQATVDAVIKLNRAALEDIDNVYWEGARTKLLEALEIAYKAGLDNHPVAARTYVHVGFVHITGFNDRVKGVRSFRHAIDIQPDIRLTRSLGISPEVADAFEEAGGQPTRPTLDCPVPQQTRIDEAVPVRCVLTSNRPVTKVFLLVRDPMKERFIEVELKKDPDGAFHGQIPQRVIYGDAVQFYFEGRNAAGKPIARNGTERRPNAVFVVKRERRSSRIPGELDTVSPGLTDHRVVLGPLPGQLGGELDRDALP
jgi:hypothetical protein